ncbi:MAG: 6,7-dimethyl-8-ribityllumazine synthase [Burkholderiales bacterium]|nr:6,7-dimethyl-8-ribityllumazine synthase [Burkholderiales bacterium]
MNQTSLHDSPSRLAAAETAPGSALRVAVVSSAWHRDIVDRARQSLLAELERRWPTAPQVTLIEVPGAFEIPLHALQLARSGRFDAIVACGLVVNGGIYRHEFVASAVIDGLMQVQLQTGVPVLSAVLTPRDFHEHEDHLRFFGEHFVKKGQEVARACVETVSGLRALARGGSLQ